MKSIYIIESCKHTDILCGAGEHKYLIILVRSSFQLTLKNDMSLKIAETKNLVSCLLEQELLIFEEKLR
jgi:hypothetical protein